MNSGVYNLNKDLLIFSDAGAVLTTKQRMTNVYGNKI